MALTHAYTTVADLAVELELAAGDATRLQAKLERAIAAASRQIDAHTGWTQHGFWADTTVQVRTYEPEEAEEIYIPEGISTATGLIVKTDQDGDGTYEVTLSNSDLILCPVNALADWPAHPYTEIEVRPTSQGVYFPTGLENSVQITAKFGWPAVPDDVEKACLVQATQLFKAGDAAFGGVQLGLDGGVLRLGTRLHPMAEALLERYVKP